MVSDSFLKPIAAALFAVAAGAGSAAGAQSLIDSLLAEQSPVGVCTCTTIEPPNDCNNAPAIVEARQRANDGRGEVRAQCARDWTAQCEEQYGWQACASAEAQTQKNQLCDDLVEQWWSEVAQPQLGQISAQCRAANDAFVEACTTEIRPRECVSCDNMAAEIASLEAEIDGTRSWLARMRGGEVVLTPQDEVLIGQRTEELERLERSHQEKQTAYAMLQDTEFCPAT